MLKDKCRIKWIYKILLIIGIVFLWQIVKWGTMEPYYSKQWSLHSSILFDEKDFDESLSKCGEYQIGNDIGCEYLWKDYCKLNSESKVRVAVIDTGIDYTHEDLQGKIWNNIGEICPVSKIIEAIQYAENSGAQICNISMTVEENDELAETIENSNMLFIVAAGNNDSIGGVDIDKYPVYPASLRYDNIITVANLSWEGNLYITSNYGKEAVDIAAPGVCIYSTTVNNHYAYNTGTSFSTPLVTGAAVYLYAVDPTISASEARKKILSNAIEKKDLCMSVKKGRVLKVGKLIDSK